VIVVEHQLINLSAIW